MAAGRVVVSVLGGDALRRALAASVPRLQMALDRAIYAEANNILSDAKKRTPVDTGTLRASGYVTLPQPSGAGSRVEAGFGGAAKKYAAVVHERVYRTISEGEYELLVPVAHDPGTGAKFLESAVSAAQGGMAERIGARVARSLAPGVTTASQSRIAALAPTMPSEERLPPRAKKSKKKSKKKKKR